jgi:hypothetical protein
MSDPVEGMTPDELADCVIEQRRDLDALTLAAVALLSGFIGCFVCLMIELWRRGS